MNPSVQSDRRHDLDALRASAMILGIIYHGALSLALGFPWFVQDASANKSLYVFQSWVHGFRMPLFFILSGFFTAMLWKKRGAKALVWHRFCRILLPCILGAVTLVPLCNLAIGNAAIESSKRRAKAVLNEPPEKSIWAAIRLQRVDAVESHLDKGFAWSELHPEFKTTALSWAAINGDTESVRLLLDRGCDPSVSNPDGNTPLHAAMFLGRSDVAELLLQRGADPFKKNNNNETPIDSLRGETAFVSFIANILLLNIDLASVKHERILIENELKRREIAVPQASATQAGSPQAPQSQKKLSERLKPVGQFLQSYPVFSYLWFLWFLWWYAVLFALVAWPLSWISTRWSISPVTWAWIKPHSIGAMVLWIAITLIPIHSMKALGFIFGPDTSVSFLPEWQVLAYYAIFFLFGVGYYLSEEAQAQLGKSWPWLLPVSMLVLFPAALEINLGTFGYRDHWIPGTWVRPLSILSQSLFAWCMSLACIGLFRSCLDKQKPWIRYLSDSSYWLYVAHLPLVVLVQTKIADSNLNGFLKLLLLSTLCIALLLLSYQLLVRHTWLGRFLNGPRSSR